MISIRYSLSVFGSKCMHSLWGGFRLLSQTLKNCWQYRLFQYTNSYRERSDNFEWITISKTSLLITIYKDLFAHQYRFKAPLFFDIDFSFETTTLLYHLISSDYRILTHSVISVSSDLSVSIFVGFYLASLQCLAGSGLIVAIS